MSNVALVTQRLKTIKCKVDLVSRAVQALYISCVPAVHTPSFKALDNNDEHHISTLSHLCAWLKSTEHICGISNL